MDMSDIIRLMVMRVEARDLMGSDMAADVEREIDERLKSFGIDDTENAKAQLELDIRRIYAAQEIARNKLLQLYREALPA